MQPPAGKNSSATLEEQLQTPVPARLRVIVLPTMEEGASFMAQVTVAVPAVASPETDIVQLLLDAGTPVLAAVGLVPLFKRSSTGTFNEEASASPTVTFARA